MTQRITLRGISWDHPRGLQPLQRTLASWSRLEPNIGVAWRARSLLGFGEEPIEALAARYDLIVMDHPFVGQAAASGAIRAIDDLVDQTALDELAANSIGPSYDSYVYTGHVWALPLDAAAQVAAYRPDLLVSVGNQPPVTWAEVIGLARWLQSSGTTVALPMIHTDLVPTFFTLAANLGEVPLAQADRRVLSPTHLDRVLDLLLELRDAAHPDSPFMDPPRLFDRMSTTDDIAYCPLAFGYTNYAREGFRRKRLRFVDMPSASPAPVGSTLGGAGIAISARCRYPAAAAQYARWLCAPDVQLGSYFDGGGQPANRSAWIKEHTNEATHGFFRDTIATLDAANVRPRWPGYLVFQDLAGPALHEYVLGDIDRPTLGRRLEDARLASLLARADQEARM